MSLIIHRCPDCGHNDLQHAENPGAKKSCSFDWCPCHRSRRSVVAENPSEVIPTYDVNTKELIEAVTPPGEYAPGGPPTRLCACPSCVALHSEVAA